MQCLTTIWLLASRSGLWFKKRVIHTSVFNFCYAYQWSLLSTSVPVERFGVLKRSMSRMRFVVHATDCLWQRLGSVGKAQIFVKNWSRIEEWYPTIQRHYSRRNYCTHNSRHGPHVLYSSHPCSSREMTWHKAAKIDQSILIFYPWRIPDPEIDRFHVAQHVKRSWIYASHSRWRILPYCWPNCNGSRGLPRLGANGISGCIHLLVESRHEGLLCTIWDA